MKKSLNKHYTRNNPVNMVQCDVSLRSAGKLHKRSLVNIIAPNGVDIISCYVYRFLGGDPDLKNGSVRVILHLRSHNTTFPAILRPCEGRGLVGLPQNFRE